MCKEHSGKEEGPQEHGRSGQARDRDEGAERVLEDIPGGDYHLWILPHPPTPPISWSCRDSPGLMGAMTTMQGLYALRAPRCGARGPCSKHTGAAA